MSCAFKPPEGLSSLNMLAVNAWRTLDAYGRTVNTFSGAPMPLRLEAIDNECLRQCDPDGVRWRVFLIEEIIYEMRVKRYMSEREKDTSTRNR